MRHAWGDLPKSFNLKVTCRAKTWVLREALYEAGHLEHLKPGERFSWFSSYCPAAAAYEELIRHRKPTLMGSRIKGQLQKRIMGVILLLWFGQAQDLFWGAGNSLAVSTRCRMMLGKDEHKSSSIERVQ